jgi:hypothetical protein
LSSHVVFVFFIYLIHSCFNFSRVSYTFVLCLFSFQTLSFASSFILYFFHSFRSQFSVRVSFSLHPFLPTQVCTLSSHWYRVPTLRNETGPQVGKARSVAERRERRSELESDQRDLSNYKTWSPCAGQSLSSLKVRNTHAHTHICCHEDLGFNATDWNLNRSSLLKRFRK